MMNAHKIKAPTPGLWPGVAGISHDGDTYCVACALEMEYCTREQALGIDGESTDQLPWTSVILASSEWIDDRPVCGRMGDCVHAETEDDVVELDVRVYKSQ